VADSELDAFERVVAQFGGKSVAGDEVDVGPYFGPLLHSPPFAANRAEQSTLVRTAGERPDTYSHADREFVNHVLSAHLQTNAALRTHLPDAIAVGLRIEAIEALRAGDDSRLTDDERLLASYIRRVVDGTVTDELFDAMELRLGTRGIVEYTVFITMLQMTLRQMQAFGADEPSDLEIEAMLADFRSGRREASNWRERIR
jgi:hypothetical protein